MLTSPPRRISNLRERSPTRRRGARISHSRKCGEQHKEGREQAGRRQGARGGGAIVKTMVLRAQPALPSHRLALGGRLLSHNGRGLIHKDGGGVLHNDGAGVHSHSGGGVRSGQATGGAGGEEGRSERVAEAAAPVLRGGRACGSDGSSSRAPGLRAHATHSGGRRVDVGAGGTWPGARRRHCSLCTHRGRWHRPHAVAHATHHRSRIRVVRGASGAHPAGPRSTSACA